VIGAVAASVACAGVLAGATVQLLAPEDAPAAATQPAAQPQSFNQEGRLIAVNPDSVTAQTVDGIVQTYRVTPDTTALTVEGNRTVSPATTFAVNDEVAIVGVVQGGTAVATTVADRQVSGLNGPPMDAGFVQPASHITGPAPAA
jgi:sulfur carrier protein ThiS